MLLHVASFYTTITLATLQLIRGAVTYICISTYHVLIVGVVGVVGVACFFCFCLLSGSDFEFVDRRIGRIRRIVFCVVKMMLERL